MKIGFSSKATNTDAFALIAEGWNEVVQDGYTPDGDGVCPVRPDDEVVYATSDEGDVVGVIAWRLDRVTGVAEVSLFYVESSSRRRGVFKAMMEALVKACAERGAERLATRVGAMNGLAHTVMNQLKRRAQYVTYDLGP